MLELKVQAAELFIDDGDQFIDVPETKLVLEHSLVSISKWESNWKKSFLSSTDKTNAEYIDYIKCMTITQRVNPYVYRVLSSANFTEIADYINEQRTATTVRETTGKKSNEIITSEVIYYWMITLNIPIECQKWHLSRLLTLIKVANAKQNPKKMSKKDVYKRNRELNAERRKKLNSKG